MARTILFDLDGTLFDLYGTENWLDLLLSETKGLFRNLRTMHPKEELVEVINALIEQGDTVEVVTWTPKNVSREYIDVVEQEKLASVREHFPMIQNVHCLDYGTPKQKANFKKAKKMILVDDNQEVNSLWETPQQRKSILADENLITKLKALLI